MNLTAIVHTRATLGRVLDDLGTTLLEVLAGRPDREAPISSVVIHDPYDRPDIGPGTLLLGVGVRDADEIASLLAIPGVTALVVRVPREPDRALADAAAASGATLLGLTSGASWAQVAALLRNLLAVDDVGGPATTTPGGHAIGDLFALANAIAALLDAPVTIEDRNLQVLAFSAGQDDADASRVETVLGRQVPERFASVLEGRGVFRTLYSSDDPIYIADLPGVDLGRVAVRVRAGDEILGSIWAAVSEPLTPDRAAALSETSKVVALHLLRARAGADVERRLRSELLATVLEGGSGAGDAASRLGLDSGALCVLALGLRSGDDAARGPRDEAEFQQLCAAFILHLSAVHPRSVAASVGSIIYGVVPASPSDERATERAAQVAREFLDRLGSRAETVVAGIGRTVADRTGLARSRHDADRALRVLRAGRPRDRVAIAEDVHLDALLLELGDLTIREATPVTGPLARLREYDAEHRTDMVGTLRCWLDAFGDVNRAAAAVHVHPNTFRYRLRRLSEVGGIDLDDPDARFAAMLQLRLYGDLPLAPGG